MNGIVKNEYKEINKYFQNYYKEQLEIYERLKYYDNYLFTFSDSEPKFWLVSLLLLMMVNLMAEMMGIMGFETELFNYLFFAILIILIILTILIFIKSIFCNFEFKKSKKHFFGKFSYQSKNVNKVINDLKVKKTELTFDKDNIIIGLKIKDKKRLNQIERELKNGK